MNLRIILTTILFFMLLSTTALAISIAELSFDELYDQADQIVLASVQGSLLYEDEYELVNADIILYIEDVYKGVTLAAEL